MVILYSYIMVYDRLSYYRPVQGSGRVQLGVEIVDISGQ